MKNMILSVYLAGAASFLCLPHIAHAEFVVGIAGPLSGNVAFNGEQQDLGAQRAVSDLNEAGGVLGQKVKVVSVDDACDVEQAKAAAARLVAEKVNVVIGHLCSRTTIAASLIYDSAGILQISPASTNPTVTERGLQRLFRTIGRDDDQAAVAAKFILDSFPDDKIALLHDGNIYGKGLVEGVRRELENAGKIPDLFIQFKPNQKSYVDTIEDVTAAGADVVYAVSNAVNDAALLTRQLKAKLSGATMISADSMAGDGFSLIAGEAAAGTYFTFGPDARKLPSASQVVERFRDEDAYEPEGYTLYSYAAVQAWAKAVEIAGGAEGADVAGALRANTFETVIGEIGFDIKGDISGISNFVMYVWSNDGYAEVR